jgi:hypothetical protein
MNTRAIVFSAAIAISTMLGSLAPANAGKWDWLGNKPYLDCLQLWHTNDFMIPAHYNAAQRAALKEKGRRYCNRKFYGHD